MSLGHLPMTQLLIDRNCKGMCKFIHVFLETYHIQISLFLTKSNKAHNRLKYSMMKPKVQGCVYCNVVRYCKSLGLRFSLQMCTGGNMLRKIIKVFIKDNRFINNMLYHKLLIGITIR